MVLLGGEANGFARITQHNRDEVVLAENIAKSAKYVTSWYYNKKDSTCVLKYQDDCLRSDPACPTVAALTANQIGYIPSFDG